MNWVTRASKAGTDRLVGIASGATPVKALDESRIAMRIIVGVGVVTFVASAWLLVQTISSAAKLPPLPNTNKQLATQLDVLKSKDTDGDGLSDYDELYTYNSSPYLHSSAGDNISDGEKVKEGINPNCKKGDACSVPTIIPTSAATTDNGSVSVAFLRQSLKAAGAPAATVDAADDATIRSMYDAALGAGSSGSVTTNTNNTTNVNSDTSNTNSIGTGNTNAAADSTPTLSNLQNMTGTQIRTLLLGNGIDSSLLESVDDATLKTIFQQAVSNTSQ